MTESRTFPIEAGPLVHALVNRVASDLGVRALAIKGPTLAVQGLRAPRASADVDVLIHPADLERFVERMLGVGWYKSLPSTAPRIMPAHSVNLLHERWSVGIDVHHFFPGFLADSTQVFDALWDRRTTIELAGAPVLACDPVGQVAVVALHLLRDHPEGGSAALDDLRDRAAKIIGRDGLAELLCLARQSDSVGPLRPFLLSLDVQVDNLGSVENTEGFALWTTYTTAEASAPWVLELASTPKYRWPRVIWHAVMLSDEEIRALHGVPSGQGLAHWRWRRVQRGLRTVPPAVVAHLRRRRVARSGDR